MFEVYLTELIGGNGFVVIENSNEFQIPKPMKMKDKEVYSLAVFHQLHCLVSFKALWYIQCL
jgi:hypothetical protein